MEGHGLKGQQMEGIEGEGRDIRPQLVGRLRTGHGLSAIQAGKSGGGNSALSHVAPFLDEPEAVLDNGGIKGIGLVGVEDSPFADLLASRAMEITAQRCGIGLQPIGDQPCVVLAEHQFLSAMRAWWVEVHPFLFAEEERPKGEGLAVGVGLRRQEDGLQIRRSVSKLLGRILPETIHVAVG